jgi:hypothetical protein
MDPLRFRLGATGYPSLPALDLVVAVPAVPTERTLLLLTRPGLLGVRRGLAVRRLGLRAATAAADVALVVRRGLPDRRLLGLLHRFDGRAE